MIKIGLVDLDTSHPGSWLPLLATTGKAQYTAIYDFGDVCSQAYVREFAATHQLRLCSSLGELVEQTDIGFIHGCNWNRHLDRAKPFVDAGKPVFLDKPIAGNLRDLLMLKEWVAKGANIIGGSVLPYAYEIDAFRDTITKNEETVISAFVTTGMANDPFNYSIHGAEMLRGLVGTDAQTVRYLASNRAVEIYEIAYRSGVCGYIQIMTPFHTFGAMVTTNKQAHQIKVDANRLYEAFITRIVRVAEGDADALDNLEAVAESVKVMLAMHQARRTGQLVHLNDLRIDDEGYDGGTFAANYRLSRNLF